MDETVPPTQQALLKALALSEEILRNLELNEIPLANIALKTSRLARLLNDFETQKAMQYEVSGYPSSGGLSPDVWETAVRAGRTYLEMDYTAREWKPFAFVESIETLEAEVKAGELALSTIHGAEAPAKSTWSSFSPIISESAVQRGTFIQRIQTATARLASRRNFIYQYVASKYYELKFSEIASDVFARIRERVDLEIGRLVPDAVKRLTAVYENLRSQNPEDWSNAVHSCRRILMGLADAVFPARGEARIVQVDDKEQTVKLGKEQYVNRIMAFVQDSGSSKRFSQIVGSHLAFIGNRLDSVAQAAQKGSHDTIISREEADRYVVYTYLLIGDILSLRKE